MAKLVIVMMATGLALNVFAGTLFITAKKTGHNQDINMTYVHVETYGYNSAGDFVVRFHDGNQISLGKRSSWEQFDYTYINDQDILVP